MNLKDLNFMRLALVNFKSKQVLYITLKDFKDNEAKLKDFYCIDEFILEPVLKLNSGNFHTTFSCSGHALELVYIIHLGSKGYTYMCDGTNGFNRAYIVVDDFTKTLLNETINQSKHWTFNNNSLEIKEANYIDLGNNHCKVDDINFDIWTDAMKELYDIIKPIKSDFTYIQLTDLKE